MHGVQRVPQGLRDRISRPSGFTQKDGPDSSLAAINSNCGGGGGTGAGESYGDSVQMR